MIWYDWDIYCNTRDRDERSLWRSRQLSRRCDVVRRSVRGDATKILIVLQMFVVRHKRLNCFCAMINVTCAMSMQGKYWGAFIVSWLPENCVGGGKLWWVLASESRVLPSMKLIWWNLWYIYLKYVEYEYTALEIMLVLVLTNWYSMNVY